MAPKGTRKTLMFRAIVEPHNGGGRPGVLIGKAGRNRISSIHPIPQGGGPEPFLGRAAFIPSFDNQPQKDVQAAARCFSMPAAEKGERQMPAESFTGPTVAALSTPAAPAGLGVVRVSGRDAVAVASRVFRPASPSRSLDSLSGYTAAYGHVTDEEGDIDECVALVFRAPHSLSLIHILCSCGCCGRCGWALTLWRPSSGGRLCGWSSFRFIRPPSNRGSGKAFDGDHSVSQSKQQ